MDIYERLVFAEYVLERWQTVARYPVLENQAGSNNNLKFKISNL